MQQNYDEGFEDGQTALAMTISDNIEELQEQKVSDSEIIRSLQEFCHQVFLCGDMDE